LRRDPLELEACIAALDAAVGNAEGGLPEAIFRFVSRVTPLVNVDLLIQEEHRTLLTWRDDEFYGPGWHLPGGIIRFKEPAAHRVRACAREELAAEVSFEPEPLLVWEGIGPHQTRGHHVSLLYRCQLSTRPDEGRRAAGSTPARGQWHWHDRCPPNLIPEQTHYACFL